ncbi:hypothetical protein FO519_002532 [Halicephalobus sp. NKZ332]|nr:hypothetical protein FO519_002532 [Halicephalobus sp. NKZ332]
MENFVAQLAQLWVVAHCKCTRLRSWHSSDHLDCLSIEPWIVEQFNEIAKTVNYKSPNNSISRPASEIPKLGFSNEELSPPNFTESLDSLQGDTITAVVGSSLLEDLGEASFYEDALDDSDEDWTNFHQEALTHMTKVEEMARHRKPVNLLEASSSRPVIQHQSSSSEHSSIERINTDAFRSRRGTSMTPKRRSHKSGNSSTSNGGAATPDEWKLVNYAFQEAASYPILFQLNQQLQSISNQLTDLASCNSIQLKITYKLLKTVLKLDRQQRTSVSFWSKLALFFLAVAASPIIFRIFYKLYQL